MGELEGYDEVMLNTHIDKWKELIVDNHEFCRSVTGRKPINRSSTKVHLAPWLEGEFVGLLPMFQPKAHGLILLG